MSFSISSLLEDAKKLVEKLETNDELANDLWKKANEIQLKTDALCDLSAKMDMFNSAANHRPKSEIVSEIEESCRQVVAFQKDNVDLEQAIRDHRDALAFMVSRYKTHVAKLHLVNKAEEGVERPLNLKLQQKNELAKERLEEVVAVMKASKDIDDEFAIQDEHYLKKLIEDNIRYKQRFQSLSRLVPNLIDEQVQTEISESCTPISNCSTTPIVSENEDCDSENSFLNLSNSSTNTVIDTYCHKDTNSSLENSMINNQTLDTVNN